MNDDVKNSEEVSKVKLRKGDRIETTGLGRTANWPRKFQGTVEMRRGNQVFVQWDNCFVSDQMEISEVQLIKQEMAQ